MPTTLKRTRFIASKIGCGGEHVRLEALMTQSTPVLNTRIIAASMGAVDHRNLDYWIANAPLEAALSEPVAPTIVNN